MSTINNDLLGSLFAMLTTEVVVPSAYHAQVKVVKQMLRDDVSGLVDSLTDFAVTTSSIDFTIETKSEELTKILKQWLDNINRPYRGKIPAGIQPLAEEYFKERWKSSSFPVLKIAGWERQNGILLPSKMFFVDGESIYAEDKNNNGMKTLLNYDYYLGKAKKNKLGKNVFFTKPYGRWFDKYPTPFLIKRGIYHNWKIIESLKNKETTILNQIIPYLFLIKKGSEMLDRDGVTYKDEDMKKVIGQMKELMKKVRAGKTPTRVTSWDEEIKHLIPDLSNIFNDELFAVAERNILTGLGFIDVVEATSTSRRESILNPKAFIEEVKKGVKDFKQLLKEVVSEIKEKNKGSHKKYVNSEFYITNSPITGFMTDEFKKLIRSLFKAGRISSQTAVEVVAEVDFKTEVYRIKKERAQGLDKDLYPPVTENREGQGIDIPGKEIDKDGNDIPDDKIDKTEKKEYKNGLKSNLIGAPYTLKNYPAQLKNLPAGARNLWIRTFNAVYKDTKNEKKARQGAWSNVKLKYVKKDEKWIKR